MKILGISCYHHDSAATSLKDGYILGASHEERFSREKFDKRFPINTIQWLQNHHEDWEFAAFYEETTYSQFKAEIKKYTTARPILVDHHEAHAMSSICMTDWTECAIMVVDTVGSKYSTSLGVYRNGQIEWFKRFRYPNSLGLFYSAATRLLGFQPLSDECKVMSAAAYGKPKWESWIHDNILNWQSLEGDYTLLQNLERGVGIGKLDWDIAASVQSVLEKTLLTLSYWIQKETGMTKLAYAGGVALNCVANTKLLTLTPWEEIAIQPAAGDAGCSLGAAALIERPLWEHAYLGVEDTNHISADECADRIIRGEIVPIIQGRAEFGPRALGNRSLLCAPTHDNIKKLDIIKERHNDSWRPYAPICQFEEADKFFDISQHCPYMLFTSNIIDGNFTTHDMSARLQTVTGSSNAYLWKVLEKTRQYGYPILINTSLNAKGKPIVNTVEDLHEMGINKSTISL
jgi:carbamoyltransferase